MLSSWTAVPFKQTGFFFCWYFRYKIWNAFSSAHVHGTVFNGVLNTCCCVEKKEEGCTRVLCPPTPFGYAVVSMSRYANSIAAQVNRRDKSLSDIFDPLRTINVLFSFLNFVSYDFYFFIFVKKHDSYDFTSVAIFYWNIFRPCNKFERRNEHDIFKPNFQYFFFFYAKHEKRDVLNFCVSQEIMKLKLKRIKTKTLLVC